MQFRSSDSGYTLIEVIVAIQIFLIVLTFTYTIYLFGYKFISNWNERRDLQADELILNRVLTSQLGSAQKINAIYPAQIIFIDNQYRLKSIYWSSDTLYANSRPVNSYRIKIKVDELRFLCMEEEKDFSDLDLNSDGVLFPMELKDVKAIRLDYQLYSKRNQVSDFILVAVKNNILE